MNTWEPDEGFFRGVDALTIGPELEPSILSLSAALSAEMWREFSHVPGEGQVRGSAGKLLSAVTERGESERFLRASPFRQGYARRLERKLGPDAPALMDFLCLSHPTPPELVQSWLGNERCACAIDQGLLARCGREVVPRVRFIPYHGRYYLAESCQVEEWGKKHGISPAHISVQTHENIVWLRRYAAHARPQRMLEMGSGIGMVSLELADLVPARVGAEINERNYRFSRLNQRLRQDRNVQFTRSDLFGEVWGKFDLIFFNPWQPSHLQLQLIGEFLERAPEHLTERGAVVLWISTQHTPEQDPILAAAAQFGRSCRFAVTRQIVRSWWSPERSVHTISCLIFTRGGANRRMPTQATLPAVEWRLRSAASNLVRSP